jgi:hypothetical protein
MRTRSFDKQISPIVTPSKKPQKFRATVELKKVWISDEAWTYEHYTEDLDDPNNISNEPDENASKEIEAITEFYRGEYGNPNLFHFDILDWPTIKEMKLPLYLKQSYVQRYQPIGTTVSLYNVLVRALHMPEGNYMIVMQEIQECMESNEFILRTNAYELMVDWMLDPINRTKFYDVMKGDITKQQKREWDVTLEVYWHEIYLHYVQYVIYRQAMYLQFPGDIPDLLFAAISIQFNINILIYQIPPIQPMILFYTTFRNRWPRISYNKETTQNIFIGHPTHPNIFEYLYISTQPRPAKCPAQMTF